MRTLMLVPILAVSLVIAGCGDSTGVGGEDITGTYNLQTINGKLLPVIVANFEDYRAEITAGRAMLGQDRHFSESLTVRVTTPESVSTETDDISGSYQHADNSITITFDDGSQAVGSVDGSTLMFRADTTVYVFRR